MATFRYKVRTTEGDLREGTVEATTMDLAVKNLQRQQYIIVDVVPAKSERSLSLLLGYSIERITQKDVVLLSRQLATLFEARVPVVKALQTLSSELGKESLQKRLTQVMDDIQGGMSMSRAMSRHPKLFSDFYVNMVRSGEESGKLGETFLYLADYLERAYELRSKTKSALMYPAFVMLSFVIVMVIIVMFVIPNIAVIFDEAAVALPIYTRIVIGASNFFNQFWILIFLFLSLSGVSLWRYISTPSGKMFWARLAIELPVVGQLNKKVYLARMSDNLQTLLTSGVPVIRSLEITADVVGNAVYREILLDSIKAVKGGATISDALGRYEEVPGLVSQMIKIGEETGKLGTILKSLSLFYKREVDNVIDSLVSLIEPVLIIVLGLGVAFLVASVLLPLYSITAVF